MKPYYRILRLNHGRAPTVQHATREAAETEALRLAGQHPGETFEILQCLGIARTTEPSIFWNDGVDPPAPGKGQEGWDPRPVPSYRMLELGEQVLPGDEFKTYRGDWIPTCCLAEDNELVTHHVIGRYRRPVQAYRMLEAGEQIEEGDECSTSGSWLPVHSHVVGESLFACNVGFFRRKISKP